MLYVGGRGIGGKSAAKLCKVVRAEWPTWAVTSEAVGLKASDVFFPSERAFRSLQRLLSWGDENLQFSPSSDMYGDMARCEHTLMP